MTPRYTGTRSNHTTSRSLSTRDERPRALDGSSMELRGYRAAPPTGRARIEWMLCRRGRPRRARGSAAARARAQDGLERAARAPSRAPLALWLPPPSRPPAHTIEPARQRAAPTATPLSPPLVLSAPRPRLRPSVRLCAPRPAPRTLCSGLGVRLTHTLSARVRGLRPGACAPRASPARALSRLICRLSRHTGRVTRGARLRPRPAFHGPSTTKLP